MSAWVHGLCNQNTLWGNSSKASLCSLMKHAVMQLARWRYLSCPGTPNKTVPCLHFAFPCYRFFFQPLLLCWCLFGKGEGERRGWEVQSLFLKLREAASLPCSAILPNITDIFLRAKFMTCLAGNESPGLWKGEGPSRKLISLRLGSNSLAWRKHTRPEAGCLLLVRSLRQHLDPEQAEAMIQAWDQSG